MPDFFGLRAREFEDLPPRFRKLAATAAMTSITLTGFKGKVDSQDPPALLDGPRLLFLSYARLPKAHASFQEDRTPFRVQSADWDGVCIRSRVIARDAAIAFRTRADGDSAREIPL